MSGHSKWKTIKHAKGLADAKKGASLTRVSKEIIIATQLGGSGDPKVNSYLRVAIEKARNINMTSEKIEKAINKGLGRTEGDNILEKTYEVNGFGGAIFLIDCETDNPNRTITELKTIVGKSEGKMVPEGSLSWQFTQMGKIVLEVKSDLQNKEYEVISINGVVDTEIDNDTSVLIIYTQSDMLKQVLDSIKENIKDAQFSEANLVKIAKDKVELNDELLEKNFDLIEKIKSHPDVVYVWDNIN